MAPPQRSSNAAPILALAGQSAATYFMDFGRGHGPGTSGRGPGGGGPDGGMPAATVRHLPPRNRLGQFRSGANDEDEDDALAA